VERCELLELWQILPLSLEHLIEHRSGIGTATNEGRLPPYTHR
jgi:hypothetical protein